VPLNDDDVREILRLIDESDLAELRIETGELSLHVVRDEGAVEPAPARPTPIAAEAEIEAGPEAATTEGPEPIPSPMLGIFYRAPAPGASPFVEVGESVEENTVVGLIEVMKMMNPVTAGVVGRITEVCVENAELVEAGEVLFRVKLER
jgi:acetyl-CoA carboxylase biotin carboxyl carrier protein